MRGIGFYLAILFVFAGIKPLAAQDTIRNNVEIEEDTTIFKEVDVFPEFPGGENARMQFLRKNLKYPKKALELGVDGTVLIRFVVEKDGSSSNFEVIESPHPALEEEAIRILKMMPNWKPGMLKDEPVRTLFLMPIKFVLDR